MENIKDRLKIEIESKLEAPIENVWECWTNPKHIINWNHASDDWHCPKAINELKKGGKLSWRMESKDGKHAFDFNGTYTLIEPNKKLNYTMEDGRKVEVYFEDKGNHVLLREVFEAENMNSLEMQKNGWQAILDNFKKYVESKGNKIKQNFKISINAPIKKVYDTMLDEKTYPKWTSVFDPSSRYEGSWEKGSKILFLGTNEKGENMGMYSMIRENIPAKFVSIEHMGIIKDNEEVDSGIEAGEWTGGFENYSFSEKDGKSIVEVEVDSPISYKDYFEKIWPLALEKLKQLCEK